MAAVCNIRCGVSSQKRPMSRASVFVSCQPMLSLFSYGDRSEVPVHPLSTTIGRSLQSRLNSAVIDHERRLLTARGLFSGFQEG